MNSLKGVVSATVAALGLSLSAGAYAGVGTPDVLTPGTANTIGATLFDQYPPGVTGPGLTTFGSMSADIAGVTLDGFVHSQWVRNDTHNPFDPTGTLGYLDFMYTIENVVHDSASSAAIGRLSLGGFAGFSTEVGVIRYFDPDGTGSAPFQPPALAVYAFGGPSGILPSRNPFTVDRSGSGILDDNGNVIAWSFGGSTGKLPVNKSSAILIVYTNATLFEVSGVGLLDTVGATSRAFTPSAIPEPETYAMMLAGLGLMGFVARRRKARNI